jgi:uncharacterized protein YbjQ (UPF0145 family)
MTLGEKLRCLRLVEGTLRGLEREMKQAEVSRNLKRELGDSISQACLSHQDAGGNGVVGMRYEATEIAQGVAEVLAYGTAIVVEVNRE